MIITSTTLERTMEHNLEELKDLHIDYDGETTFGAYTINVHRDDDAESPREWDNLGTMVHWHPNYTLGDVNGRNEYSDPDMFWYDLAGIEDTDSNLNKAIELAEKKNIILPLYVYEHGGITMSTGAYSCPWDSSQVGWIYISLEKVRKEFSCKRVSAKMREKIEGYLKNEVKSFDDYITGNVYGFSITREDPDGEEVDVDSCWGFLGDPEDYMFGEIKSNIKYDIKATPAQAELF